MRGAGMSYRQIGEALHCDHTWARTLVLRALDSIEAEQADQLRSIEGARLDALTRAMWPKALGGDDKAATVVLRIMDRRARLFGLDHADGIAERMARVQEHQVDQLDAALHAILDGLNLTRAQRALARVLVPQELRALTAVPDLDDVVDGELVEEADG